MMITKHVSWAMSGLALLLASNVVNADNLTVGQHTERLMNSASKAVDSAGEVMSSASKSVGKYTDDSVITAKVKKKLYETDEVNSLDISVKTQDGVVTLTGFVNEPKQSIEAIKAASSVEGVKRVSDKLHIKLSSDTSIKSYVADATITSEIKAALLTEKGIPSMSINVETVDGVVQLSGDVDNADQIERAEIIAWKVDGVKSVKNDLVVKP